MQICIDKPRIFFFILEGVEFLSIFYLFTVCPCLRFKRHFHFFFIIYHRSNCAKFLDETFAHCQQHFKRYSCVKSKKILKFILRKSGKMPRVKMRQHYLDVDPGGYELVRDKVLTVQADRPVQGRVQLAQL